MRTKTKIAALKSTMGRINVPITKPVRRILSQDSMGMRLQSLQCWSGKPGKSTFRRLLAMIWAIMTKSE